ncbi:uncharacterized protein LOC121979414 [Zingiber officinale]|uniref:uncharacterized protein LOC121979414 n=1 Tax=Zingiber officinale TaxID=94328 RepID=UPI001C4CFBF0|nr:uncharacterized protein LOC121979414 [Zingiber officinale]
MEANAHAAALLAELNQDLELIKQMESHLHDLDLCRALAPRLMSSIQNSILIASDRPPSSETPKRRYIRRKHALAAWEGDAMHSRTRKVRLSSVAGESKVLKYGQKESQISKSLFPVHPQRAPPSAAPHAKKLVQRSDNDLLVFDVTYHELLTCLQQRREQEEQACNVRQPRTEDGREA